MRAEIQPQSSSSGAVHKSDLTRHKQARITSFCHNPLSLRRRKNVDFLLMNMIVKDFQSFSMVDSIHFQAFIRALNPNYEILSRQTLSNSLLNELYGKTLSTVKEEISNCKVLSLTTYGWTSSKTESFYVITANFINDNCSLQSRLLSSFKFHGDHTVENIAAQLTNILDDWQYKQNVIACVQDNAANITKAIHIAK